MLARALCVAVGVLAAVHACAASVLTVDTEYGPVTGMTDTLGPLTARSWRGIPYAAPPTGLLRWQPPKPPANWTAPLDATVYGAGCPQTCDLPPHTCPVRTDESCLFLNVWSPTGADQSSALPVLFWVHGGHFDQGSGEGPFYSGLSSASPHDTVVVTINYRLGALGFLRNDDAGIGGNFGFFDQIFALEWVQRNIRSFGGDPAKVTIYGQSAGGSSVAAITTSPLGRGLFRNVIMESNPIGLPFMAPKEGNSLGGRFASDLGCSESDATCMRAASPTAVLAAQKKAAKHLNIGDLLQIFYPWTPAIDGHNILDEPLRLMQRGQVNVPVSFVAGTVQEEGLIFIYMGFSSKMSHLEYDGIVGGIFFNKLQLFKVLKQYPGHSGDNRVQLARLATDYLFKCPLRSALRGLEGVTNTYQYRFNHSFSFDGWGPNYTYCDGHVCHGSELPFVFNLQYDSSVVTFSPGEKTLGNNINAAWNAVAHSDAPTATPSWPRYSAANNETYVWMSGGQQFAEQDINSICDFWDEIGWNF